MDGVECMRFIHWRYAFHAAQSLKKALENGVKREEIIAAVTHLAFYSRWPTANTALPIIERVFNETK